MCALDPQEGQVLSMATGSSLEKSELEPGGSAGDAEGGSQHMGLLLSLEPVSHLQGDKSWTGTMLGPESTALTPWKLTPTSHGVVTAGLAGTHVPGYLAARRTVGVIGCPTQGC